MNDPLSRLHRAAARLLGGVDETLARCGAPDHHPIWPLLRSVGLLPGDAVAEVAALSLEAFQERAGLMRSHRERGTGVDDLLVAPSGWEGAAAEAAAARLEAARAGMRVITENAGVLAGLLGDLAEFGKQGRVRLARGLARVLASAQAVDLSLDEVEPLVRAQAAADIGAEVLAEVAGFWAGAREIARDRLARLEPVPVPVPDGSAAASGGGRLAVEY